MYSIDDFTRVNLEKIVFLEVLGSEILFVFDNGSEVKRNFESQEKALKTLEEIDKKMTRDAMKSIKFS